MYICFEQSYLLRYLLGSPDHLQETYDVEVYLEPGEAIALDAGYMLSRVMDIALLHKDGECEVVRHFGYEDFKNRLS